jgi:hypothetical protein
MRLCCPWESIEETHLSHTWELQTGRIVRFLSCGEGICRDDGEVWDMGRRNVMVSTTIAWLVGSLWVGDRQVVGMEVAAAELEVAIRTQ